MDPATRRQAVGATTLVALALAGWLLLSPRALLKPLTALGDQPLLFGTVLLGAYLLRPALAWPISAVSIAVGVVLGAAGVPVALGGAVLTCLPPYLLARTTGESGALGTAGDVGERYFRATGALRGVIAARLAPFPADPVSYTAGLARVPVGAYAVGTAVGELPWVVAAVLVGASAERLVTTGATVVPLIVGASAVAALLLAGPVYRRVETKATE